MKWFRWFRQEQEIRRTTNHLLRCLMSLSAELKASTDALTAAVAAIPVPAPSTPDADVQAAIDAVNAAAAALPK